MPLAEERGDRGLPAAAVPVDELAALMAVGLGDPIVFGRYRLLGRLPGRGTAAVYEARASSGTIVALKCLERHRSHSDGERFKREAELTRSLGAHPNIIPVLDIGEADGVPYYTMPFAEGGTLLEWYRDEAPEPARLAGVLAQIARAVHHAHVHMPAAMLHRDLKPTNILMDRDGIPYVADFGVAKALGRDEGVTAEALVGTLDYMAPEQALGPADKLTAAADIYSLGVVLYELVTATVPVPGANIGEFLQRLLRAEPIVAPHRRVAGVHRGLENICLQCLESDPRRRYATAQALADDFERVREGRPPLARPPSRSLRLVRWMRRHARVAYAGATAVAILAVALVALAMIWRGLQREQDRTLDSNASIASGQAGAALFQLREYADHVVSLRRDATVLATLARGTVRRDAPELRPLLGAFDGIIVMTSEARILSQWPAGADRVYQRSYEFRDYFRGARRLGVAKTPGAYVARAFLSESHGDLRFAISTPVLDEHANFIGVVVGTLNAKAAFGAVRMEETPQSGRIITALIGPRGNDRNRGPDAPVPADFAFLVHPGMDWGVEHPVRSPTPAALRERFGLSAPPGQQLTLQYASALQVVDYRDPVPGFEGEWLAAVAPVGKTGFLVLVATRKAPAFPWKRSSR